MKNRVFKIQGIDHVELFVPDRWKAADWYATKFGFTIIELPGSDWGLPRGPLMISTDGGNTKLALFEGQPRGNRDTAGFHRVAFLMSGTEFLKLLIELPTLELTDDSELKVERKHVKDYGRVFSLYCCDPYGHRLEFITYDYELVESSLNS